MIKMLFVLAAVICTISVTLLIYWNIGDGTRHNRTMQDLILIGQMDVLDREVIDPWGEPYLQVSASSGNRTATWFFSKGPDRQSKTLGNDPDDIALWTGWLEWLDGSYPASKILWISFVSGIAAIGLGASLVTRRHQQKISNPSGGR